MTTAIIGLISWGLKFGYEIFQIFYARYLQKIEDDKAYKKQLMDYESMAALALVRMKTEMREDSATVQPHDDQMDDSYKKPQK